MHYSINSPVADSKEFSELSIENCGHGVQVFIENPDGRYSDQKWASIDLTREQTVDLILALEELIA